MKKGILFIFILFFLRVSSQTIKPFNLDNVDWTVLSCMWNAGPPYVYYFNHYQLCGDTNYQGKKYKRIFEGTASWYPPFIGMTPSKPYPQPSVYNFYGLLRQDSVLKRNYLRLPSWAGDSLLMDYNLQVGDTIKKGLYVNQMSMGPCFGSQFPVVIGTDTIQISGQKFKIYYTDSVGPQSYSGLWPWSPGYFFIEGLGHINGVFENQIAQEYYCHPFENCVGVDTIIFNSLCNNLAGVRMEKEFLEIDVYPVPTSNELYLENIPVANIKVFNSLGELVLTRSSKATKFKIDVGGLKTGIYFLVIEAKDRTYSRKFIKD